MKLLNDALRVNNRMEERIREDEPTVGTEDLEAMRYQNELLRLAHHKLRALFPVEEKHEAEIWLPE